MDQPFGNVTFTSVPPKVRPFRHHEGIIRDQVESAPKQPPTEVGAGQGEES